MPNRSQDKPGAEPEVGESRASPQQFDSRVAFVGAWSRTSEEPCSHAYPERIEFRADGVYLTAADDDVFREWQAGDFEVVAERVVKIQMSNDAMAPYEFCFTDRDHLIFEDRSGCRIEYERVRQRDRP